MEDLSLFMSDKAALIEEELDKVLPPETTPPVMLHRAMRYSVLGSGKRLRPILCMAAAEAAGGTSAGAVRPALAVELLHTYTLIHDDLPCMDDDDLRRGKPTAHKAFGEANALLAGDALQALAFSVLAAPGVSPATTSAWVSELARAAGSRGVVGGQVADLAFAGEPPTAERIAFIHLHKTADLFLASVRLGGLAAGADARAMDALGRYGVGLGLAFQIADDLLDAAQAGAIGAGDGIEEATCLAIYTREEAEAQAQAHVREAVAAVASLDSDGRMALAELARFAVGRTH